MDDVLCTFIFLKESEGEGASGCPYARKACTIIRRCSPNARSEGRPDAPPTPSHEVESEFNSARKKIYECPGQLSQRRRK